SLFFVVHKENHRCFLVDIPAKTTIRAEYESPDTTNTLKTVLAFYAPNPVPDQENVLVKKEVTSDKGSISVTSTLHGDHWVCVSLDASEYSLPDSAKMRFVLKLAMGTSSQDWDWGAGGLEQEKGLLLQKTIESNNNKASWVSVVQITILLVTGVYQAKYLQRYFHKKKLV
ncbi:hypothetical protein PybrP1_011861, partial [[Pythium] brassicae (nom. inval.)]